MGVATTYNALMSFPSTTIFGRLFRWLTLLVACALPAFSVEAAAGASAQNPPAPVVPAAEKKIIIVPSEEKGPDTAPGKPQDKAAGKADEPSAEKESAKAAETPPAEKKQKPIALILPVGSKVFGKVADALKLGFIAGAEADGKDAPPYRVYPADDDGAALANLYRKAATDGVAAVVGGVTKDGAAQMLREAGYLPTLALNAPGEGSTVDWPDKFYFISLNIDSEARMAARAAFEEGRRRMVVLATATPLAKRLQDNFEKEWQRLGGEIALRIVYAGEPAEAEKIRAAMEKFYDKESEKYKVDGVFLAADTRSARQARPYLPASIPVIATSHTLDPRAGAVESLDLESVRFQEMPWFVERDHPAVMIYARPPDDMPIDYERLYALGIDAWRLARMIVKYEKARDIPPIDGVTGQISLDDHQFQRKLTAVEMHDGRPQLYRASE